MTCKTKDQKNYDDSSMCNRDSSSTDNEWPIILAHTCSRLKNSISHRRLFVSKSLHGIDLCRVAGGNVAGHGCDRHQERRDHN